MAGLAPILIVAAPLAAAQRPAAPRSFTTAIPLETTSEDSANVSMADLDGDGDLDALTSNDTPDKKLVFLNDGKARFTSACIAIPAASATSIVAADFDKDGTVRSILPSATKRPDRWWFISTTARGS